MTPKLFVVPAPLNAAVMLAPVLIALWRGGWRERLIAATSALSYVINRAADLGVDPSKRLARGVLALGEDLLLLAVCLGCVVRARRYWVIVATALALLSTVTDVLFLSLPDMSALVMIYASDIWAYALCATLVWASLTFRRERAEAAA